MDLNGKRKHPRSGYTWNRSETRARIRKPGIILEFYGARGFHSLYSFPGCGVLFRARLPAETRQKHGNQGLPTRKHAGITGITRIGPDVRTNFQKRIAPRWGLAPGPDDSGRPVAAGRSLPVPRLVVSENRGEVGRRGCSQHHAERERESHTHARTHTHTHTQTHTHTHTQTHTHAHTRTVAAARTACATAARSG
jgi:hypothetical protein